MICAILPILLIPLSGIHIKVGGYIHRELLQKKISILLICYFKRTHCTLPARLAKDK